MHKSKEEVIEMEHRSYLLGVHFKFQPISASKKMIFTLIKKMAFKLQWIQNSKDHEHIGTP
jgi:hypothetical protein